jgi:hypothetical protein
MMAVSSAITWFFEQVEQGIILEDDCLPDQSFFSFCEELLNKYKDDDRIGHISGNCFQTNIIGKNLSYGFCNTTHIWGWATWRRVWKDYDANLSYWTKCKNKERNNIFNNWREKVYFSSFIDDVLQGKINTWDTQYLFMLRLYSRLSIYPSVNLVTNIGLNIDGATHISAKNKKFHVLSKSISLPLVHPEYVVRNKLIDKKTVQNIFFSWKRLIRYLLKKRYSNN